MPDYAADTAVDAFASSRVLFDGLVAVLAGVEAAA
jgi:hypothetical protein